MESGSHFIRQRVPQPLSMLGKRFPQLAEQAVEEPVKLFSPSRIFVGGTKLTFLYKKKQTCPETLHACCQWAVVTLRLACDRNKSLANTLRFFFSFRAKPIMSWRCKKPNVCLNFIKKVNNCICDSPGRLIVSPLVNWDNVNDCILARLEWSQRLQLIAVITIVVASWIFCVFLLPHMLPLPTNPEFSGSSPEKRAGSLFISQRMLMIRHPTTSPALWSAFWMMYDSGFKWTSFKLDLDAAN